MRGEPRRDRAGDGSALGGDGRGSDRVQRANQFINLRRGEESIGAPRSEVREEGFVKGARLDHAVFRQVGA